MNLSALPELLLSWLKSQGTGMLQAGHGQESTTTPFKPGQQYLGLVLDSLPNGRSLVKVDRQLLDMALPGKQAQVGDTVRMTFLTPGPRPTFLLNQEGAASVPQPVRLSEAAHQVSALIRYAQAPGPVATPSGQASALPPPGSLPNPPLTTQSAGQTMTVPNPPLAGRQANPAVPVAPPSTSLPAPAPSIAPATARSTAPSATAPPATSTASPAPTGQATVGQAANTQGGATAVATSPAQRPIVVNTSLLLNVPTSPTSLSADVAARGAIPGLGLVGQAIDGMRASLAPSTTLTAQGVTQTSITNTHVLPLRLRQVVKESGMFYESHLARWTKGEMGQEAVMREPQARMTRIEHMPTGLAELGDMPEEAARLAGRQLMMLEGGPFVWQGQVWPGQAMEWLVEERPGGSAEGEEAPQWQTELRLTLPRLGQVAAQIRLSAQGLQVGINATSEETLSEIRAALPELAERLQAANLNILGLSARLHDEHTTAA